ncbi:BTAD domain-containing putative transcriptional regulator [Streptomyces sp. NPDC059477]|uniref:AfsR/SARP family transcriptional regulator n=1 Tax=Streptomyces sp. NPDC059477 TaxID=3346847 RepID=UPI0036C5A9F9
MEERGIEPLRFSLLGPLRGRRGTSELALGSPQQRAVLAMLLLRRGHAVGVAELVEGVWGGEPPPGAVAVLRTYVSRLRKLLEPVRGRGQAPEVLMSLGDGYALRTDKVATDLADCEEAVAQAKQHRAGGRPDRALGPLCAALAGWDSHALAGVPGPYAGSARLDLAERRLSVLELRLRVELELGRHEAVVAELLALRDAHPMREAVSELLLLALYRCGRQAEALAAYARTRRTLIDELGIEPGPSLRALHTRLLAGDPALTPAPTPPTARTGIRPSQLPTDLPVFTGRRTALGHLTALLLGDGGPGASGATIAVVNGMAGVGKTALALHWGHRIAHRFPDGSLHVDLRGHGPGGTGMAPGEVLEAFLVALGVAPHAVPEGLDARAALYRSVLAARRVLIVLDNARDTAQVEPLLPGAAGCLVVVTGRGRFSGLVARHGAHPLTPAPLSAGESRELLARRLGGARIAAEPEAARTIVDLCAGLPLALADVAARAAHHPGFRLAHLAAELRDSHGTLDAFTGHDTGTDPRTAFSWSYRALSPGAAVLLRRLALHPGPDIGVRAAAALADGDGRRVRALLTELTGASLLIEHLPGRFVLHDLLRAYARERAAEQDTPYERDTATRRLLDHHLHTAHHAGAVLDPFRTALPLPARAADSAPLRFADGEQATTWLRAERQVLRALVEHAADQGHHEHAWRLAHALDPHFDRLGHPHDLLEIHRAALRAARAQGHPVGQAHALRGLGLTHTRLGRPGEAIPLLGKALELLRCSDGRSGGEGAVLDEIGRTYLLLGAAERGLEHCERAVRAHREAGDRGGEAAALDGAGRAYHQLRRYERAVERFGWAVRRYREIGDRRLEAGALRRLGDSHHAAGDHASARTAWSVAIALLEVDDRERSRAGAAIGPGHGVRPVWYESAAG